MKSNQNGVTLIELMLSILLFTIVFTCSIVILNKGLNVITDTANYLKGICLANQEMESIKCLKFEKIENRSFTINKFKGEIAVKDSEDGLKEIIVTIKWIGSVGVNKKVSLVSLIAKKE